MSIGTNNAIVINAGSCINYGSSTDLGINIDDSTSDNQRPRLNQCVLTYNSTWINQAGQRQIHLNYTLTPLLTRHCISDSYKKSAAAIRMYFSRLINDIPMRMIKRAIFGSVIKKNYFLPATTLGDISSNLAMTTCADNTKAPNHFLFHL